MIIRSSFSYAVFSFVALEGFLLGSFILFLSSGALAGHAGNSSVFHAFSHCLAVHFVPAEPSEVQYVGGRTRERVRKMSFLPRRRCPRRTPATDIGQRTTKRPSPRSTTFAFVVFVALDSRAHSSTAPPEFIHIDQTDRTERQNVLGVRHRNDRVDVPFPSIQALSRVS